MHSRFPKQKGLLHSVQQPLSFIAIFQLGDDRVGVGIQQSKFGTQQELRAHREAAQAQKQEQGQPQQTGSSHGKFLLSTPRFIYNNG